MSTMVFEEACISPLLEAIVPITLFLERPKEESGPQILYSTHLNMNLVFQQKWGALNYGVFHSKLILYEFDDRLRVIVPSANLYIPDWEMLSQVIWFQDFFPAGKKEKQEDEKSDNDFKAYLIKYIDDIYPKNVTQKEVYRQKIDLNKYDYSTANAYLLGSVNGRYTGENLSRYGQNRFGALCKDKISPYDKMVTY